MATTKPASKKTGMELAHVKPNAGISHYRNLNIQEIKTIALAMAQAKMFPDIQSQSTAFVKILAGQEMGIAPFQAMTGIHIINGKASTGGNLMATKVKESGRYDYKVVSMTDKGCSIDFFEIVDGKKEKIGNSEFTDAEATAAGVKNNSTWKKYPKNMFFNRAMSNGVRWFTPDVFSGAPVYTAEEMGYANVDEHGAAITDTEPEEGEIVTDSPVADLPEEPMEAEIQDGPITANQIRHMFGALKERSVTNKDDALLIIHSIGRVDSTKQLTESTAQTVIEKIEDASSEELEFMLVTLKPDRLPTEEDVESVDLDSIKF